MSGPLYTTRQRGTIADVKLARWVVVAAVLAGTSAAHAETCPTTPDDPVCRAWTALLLPTATGAIYKPNTGPTFVGGGFEAVWLAWNDNSEAFGPSQGRLRSDIAIMTSTGDMDAGQPAAVGGTIVMYRFGAQVSFERNASRAYGIPFFVADIGGFWTTGTGRRWFVDGGVGVYLVHRRSLILEADVEGLLPFQDPGDLGGITSRVALSFALW